MADYKEARTPTKQGKRIDHLQIRKTDDGVTVTHVYAEDGFNQHKPRNYDFGKDETSDLVEHLGKYAGLPIAETVNEGGE